MKDYIIAAGATVLVACFAPPSQASPKAESSTSIDSQELKELIAGESPSDFPLAAHPFVVKRLNGWLDNEALHSDVKARLERMQNFKNLIKKELEAQGLPEELLAIPYVETGFENHPGNRNGTGLWMFTKRTAEEFGLNVQAEQDERLNPTKATRAAAEVLKNYYEQFDDWLLAVAAYNQGPTRVRRAIEKAGTDNVWTLIDQGHLNRYVVKVVAAAALIKYPSLREHI